MALRVSSMANAVTMNLNSHQRDEFLKALEEARRAAMGDHAADDEPRQASPSRTAAASTGFRDAIDRLTGTLRSYISAGLAARLYSDASQTRSREMPPRAPIVVLSEHEQVVAELHLTPNLTAHDLKVIRRKFAMVNHPDRVAPPIREQATRRMTIANMLIDDALRGLKTRTL
jgi:hypothetical protein